MRKKDGKMKICIDYLALNKINIKNNYMLPQVNDLLDRLNGSKYFNRIEHKNSYY